MTPRLQWVAEPLGRRTFQPVRRCSVLAGGWEEDWYRGLPLEPGPLMQALKKFERAGRKPGRRNGPLGHVALEVAETLMYLGGVKGSKRRLYPSLLWLCRAVKRCKSAVVAALDALQTCGVLERVRRLVRAQGEGPRGPRVKQTTNVYRFAAALPAKLAAFVKPRRGPKPTQAEVAARLRRLAEASGTRQRLRRKIATAADRGAAAGRRKAEVSASLPDRLNPSSRVES